MKNAASIANTFIAIMATIFIVLILGFVLDLESIIPISIRYMACATAFTWMIAGFCFKMDEK